MPHTKVRSRSQETPELAGSGTGQERCVSKAAFGQAGDTMMSVGSGLRGRVKDRDTGTLVAFGLFLQLPSPFMTGPWLTNRPASRVGTSPSLPTARRPQASHQLLTALQLPVRKMLTMRSSTPHKTDPPGFYNG